MEEERVITEANNAVKLTEEIAHWQLKKKAQLAMNVNDSRESIFIDKKRTEPLITKAYNAFRKTSQQADEKLLSTEAYVEEQLKFRDTAISGLAHAQRLDTTVAQSLPNRDSLPTIKGHKGSAISTSESIDQPIGINPVSEEELVQHIQKLQEINNYTEGYQGQPKAMNRVGQIVNNARPSQIRKAAVVDINRAISLPNTNTRRKNKNDFYRFLLSTNRGQNESKINNDVFIPRSILKKSYVPGSIKEQRLEAAAEELFEYQLTMQQMKRDTSEEYLGKYEVVLGQHLDSNDP